MAGKISRLGGWPRRRVHTGVGGVSGLEGVHKNSIEVFYRWLEGRGGVIGAVGLGVLLLSPPPPLSPQPVMVGVMMIAVLVFINIVLANGRVD